MAKNEALNLSAIKAQAEAATEGDWFFNSYDSIWAGKGDGSERIASVSHLEYDDEGDEVPSHGDEIFGPRQVEAGANAEFIAAARSNVPALVEALEATQRKLAVAERAFKQAKIQWRRDIADLHIEIRKRDWQLAVVREWRNGPRGKGGMAALDRILEGK